MYIKADSKVEQKYFDFLEDLRQSGDTNMFGASPYLQQAFGLSRSEAIAALGKWMALHNDPQRQLDAPLTKTKRTVKIRQVAEVEEESR